MARLGAYSAARHALVGAAAVTTGVLGATGVLGPEHPDRYETWHVTVSPATGADVHVRVVFDQDFGDTPAHGPLLFVDGALDDVRVSSPDAPADVAVDVSPAETEIRIGDPDVEISGQHRYVVEYTLRGLADGTLDLDVLSGDDEFPTEHVEVVVTGFELSDTSCHVGFRDDACTVTAGGGVYRLVADDVAAGEGVRLNSTVVARTDPVEVPVPPVPPRRDAGREALLGGSLGLVGAAAAVPVYAWARRRGRNEVYAGGAADAAFGSLPPPGAPRGAASVPTTLVTDARLPELATTEFVPPRGLAPWQALVLLAERYDGDQVVEGFLSSMAGVEALVFAERGSRLVISSGPRIAALAPDDRALVDLILALGDPYTTGTYDARFAAAWKQIDDALRARVRASGWWRRGNPAASWSGGGGSSAVAGFVLLLGVMFGSRAFGAFTGGGWPAAIAFAIVVPALVAWFAYRVLLPSRSAAGSALTLQAESFRRFLAASEGRHVEWAWTHGVLREYSAWAVVLGAADAWSDALGRADVPSDAAGEAARGAYLIRRRRASFGASRRDPSATSSRGGRTGSTRVGGGRRGGGGTRRGRW